MPIGTVSFATTVAATRVATGSPAPRAWSNTSRTRSLSSITSRSSAAHVVGHSGSGLIALQLTIDAPQVVRTLVLEEPALMAIDPRWAAAVTELSALAVERARDGDARGAMEMWMEWIADTWRG